MLQKILGLALGLTATCVNAGLAERVTVFGNCAGPSSVVIVNVEAYHKKDGAPWLCGQASERPPTADADCYKGQYTSREIWISLEDCDKKTFMGYQALAEGVVWNGTSSTSMQKWSSLTRDRNIRIDFGSTGGSGGGPGGTGGGSGTGTADQGGSGGGSDAGN